MIYEAILLLPLFGALLAGLVGKRLGEHFAEYTATGLLCLTAIFSLYVFFFELPYLEATKLVPLFRFLDSGTLQVDWAIRVDTLTAVMLVVVTGVSALVHVYSIGYMHHDEHRPRFFAYLSLFTFAMLALVTADNFVQMFFGWEGVGLCSYLLIGFWYKKPSANAAAIKAFIVNRVGDFGFALGIMAIFFVFGSLDFTTVFDAAKNHAGKTFEFAGYNVDILTTICLLLFMGAMGKSAQFLLHTWLPDAMEGPTPVSALIHAATMVTAGVFMVARLSPLFELAPHALQFVTLIGAITAFFAATVGLVQNDIKRVIAYSTCSQLGYMFVACGVGAYAAGIFHLFTHAFFKALLFLGAGSVIHGYDFRKFDELVLPLGPVAIVFPPGNPVAKKNQKIEGQVTRIVYVAPPERSTLEVLRNYEQELKKGGFQILFTCGTTACSPQENGMTAFLYPMSRSQTLKGQDVSLMLTMPQEQRYIAAKRTTTRGDMYASILVAKDTNPGVPRTYNRIVVLLEVMETAALDTGLVTVNADAMAKEIDATGHIALYGIHFDTNRAELKPESDAALQEIVKLLKQDPALRLLVVGHTDNVGGYDANMTLSERRAAAVFQSIFLR